MKVNWFSIVLVVGLLFLTGCAPASDPGLQDGTALPAAETAQVSDPLPGILTATISPDPETGKEGAQMTQPVSTPSGLEGLIENAREDLAERLSVAETQISLVEARSVVWPDTSLGCPQPGMAYLQVPQDGALIILRASGQLYEYHNGGTRGLFLCEKVYKDPNPPPRLDLNKLTPLAPENNISPGEDR